MKKTQIRVFIGLAATAVFSLNANATPIEFIYTGVGSGSLGQTAFSEAAFTVTQFGNTNNLQSCGGSCNFIDADSATVTISGLGTFNFLTGTRTFDNSGMVGLSRAGSFGADLYNVFQVGAAYDMMSSIGPIFGTANLLQWGFQSVSTDGGVLFFGDGPSRGSFQAIAGANNVPEPATPALLGLGLAGIAITSLRRKRRA